MAKSRAIPPDDDERGSDLINQVLTAAARATVGADEGPSQQAEIASKKPAPPGRGKKGNGGQLGKDSYGRPRLTAEVALHRQVQLRQLAQDEDVGTSSLVDLAIARLLADVRAGRVDFHGMKVPTRSLKFSFVLNFSEDGTPIST
jgi:hypothetical protein